MERQNSSPPSGFWAYPWGFPQAVLITASCFLNGFFIEIIAKPYSLKMPAWPINFVLLALFASILVILSKMFGSKKWFSWLGGMHLAITSLVQLGVLVILAGTIPQQGHGWLARMFSSWPFLFSILLCLLNLSIAILKRSSYPKTFRNIIFLINHIGILIILLGMLFGSGDSQQLRLIASQNTAVHEAFVPGMERMPNEAGMPMPFAIKLLKFTMEEYEPNKPKSFIAKIEIIEPNKEKRVSILQVNQPEKILGWDVYLGSYDESKGKDSEWVVLELVKDPWLPVTYTGAYLLLAGMVLLFWQGFKAKR